MNSSWALVQVKRASSACDMNLSGILCHDNRGLKENARGRDAIGTREMQIIASGALVQVKRAPLGQGMDC